ncbi:ABC transporter permease [Thiospirochaeta perfilievii]|uniref:ABC transporter permease n=1 Tax=Thiospirochaeta perfilievii TaxID=252967 RepID=A0A5C1QGW1_9SPIO|nr:ABC transporter permease [Thiospirochaeta perfilievii]QEN06319.1 ABC transporter permease [Thiospirochaeta perfilievii]
MLEGIFVEGLIYGLLALGVFITFRVLDFPDLTVDGSFPLGAAVMAKSLLTGIPLPIAFLLAFISGGLAGLTTALIHNKLKVPSLLASILTMIMLYSINMRIMKAPFISLNRVPTLLTKFVELNKNFIDNRSISYLILFLIIIIITILLLNQFFHTDMGLTLGALGDNEQMIINQGMNPEHLKIIGLSLSNGLVAIAGGFIAQYQKFADINMGIGVVIIGLASVMIGELILKSNKILILLLRVVIGATIYRGILFLSRPLLVYPTDHKLFTGILIIVILTVTKFRKKGAENG